MNKKRYGLLLLSIVLLIVNTFLACCIQSNGFGVRVFSTDIITEDSLTLDAKIYLPLDADREHTRPAIVVSAGGNSEYFMVETFSVELSRRGYVVIAYTPYKHGKSSIHETYDMGAGSVIDYVSELPMVTSGEIGLLGQSRGGVYLTSAAVRHAEKVASVLTIDYVPELLQQTGFREDTPVAFGIICNRYNEYLQDPLIFQTDKEIQELFGTNSDIVPSVPYFSQGGHFRIAMVADSLDSAYPFHPQVISKTIDYFKTTLPFDGYHDCEVGVFALLLLNNIFGFVALLLLVLGVLQVMVPASDTPQGHFPCRVSIQWLGVFVGATAYIPLYMLGKRILEPTALFPQNDTNGQLIWSVFMVLYYMGIIVYSDTKKIDSSIKLVALAYEKPSAIVRMLGYAACAVGTAYLVNALRRDWFGLNFTFFCADFSVFTFHREIASLSYFLIFFVYFLAYSAYQIKFAFDKTNPRKSALMGCLMSTTGMVALYILHISGFLFVGHSLFYWGRFAFSPILYMLPLLPAQGYFTSWCFRRTRKIYLGAFVNALLFTWLFVASNAFFYT